MSSNDSHALSLLFARTRKRFFCCPERTNALPHLVLSLEPPVLCQCAHHISLAVCGDPEIDTCHETSKVTL